MMYSNIGLTCRETLPLNKGNSGDLIQLGDLLVKKLIFFYLHKKIYIWYSMTHLHMRSSLKWAKKQPPVCKYNECKHIHIQRGTLALIWEKGVIEPLILHNFFVVLLWVFSTANLWAFYLITFYFQRMKGLLFVIARSNIFNSVICIAGAGQSYFQKCRSIKAICYSINGCMFWSAELPLKGVSSEN